MVKPAEVSTIPLDNPGNVQDMIVRERATQQRMQDKR